MLKNNINKKLRQKLRQKGPSPMDAIFPPVCGFCGKLSPESLCNKCRIKLQNQANFGIEDYTNVSSYFDEHIYMFKYSGEVRNAILNYKFREKSYIYQSFVNFLKNNKKIIEQIKKYDIIVPVPISKKRLKQRGYNQSAVFANELAKFLQMEYGKDILIKIKDNNAQSTLSGEERVKNVQGVYRIKKKQKIYNKKVLLVDDIFTTGNTANECAKTLIGCCAKNVGIFSIAKD